MLGRAPKGIWPITVRLFFLFIYFCRPRPQGPPALGLQDRSGWFLQKRGFVCLFKCRALSLTESPQGRAWRIVLLLGSPGARPPQMRQVRRCVSPHHLGQRSCRISDCQDSPRANWGVHRSCVASLIHSHQQKSKRSFCRFFATFLVRPPGGATSP